jgi:heat shock protein HtpX
MSYTQVVAELERQITRNRTLTAVLAGVAILNTLLVVVIAGAVAGGTGVLVALLVIVAWVGIAYLIFNSTVLKTTGARSLRESENARILPIVERLVAGMSIDCPQLLAVDDTAANAFAVGTGSKATVVYTTELLQQLSDDELEGVTAHELSHIANGDTRIALYSAALLGWAVFVSAAVTIMAIGIGYMGISMITEHDGDEGWEGVLAKICVGLGAIAVAASAWLIGQGWVLISQIAHLAVSRQREWLADATAAKVTGKPLALAAALEKLSATDVELHQGKRLAQALCIAGGLRGEDWWKNLFDTHPDVHERIARLRSYAAHFGQAR